LKKVTVHLTKVAADVNQGQLAVEFAANELEVNFADGALNIEVPTENGGSISTVFPAHAFWKVEFEESAQQ
jgi:hypothetical protein